MQYKHKRLFCPIANHPKKPYGFSGTPIKKRDALCEHHAKKRFLIIQLLLRLLLQLLLLQRELPLLRGERG